VQPQEAASSENASAEELTGTLDRSFAGQTIPAFTVQDPDGKTLALTATTGKPVLLNLWATWCAPCVVEMPMLDKLAADLGDSVQVLTVSEDLNGADKVRAFFAEKKFSNLPQWIDPENDLAIAFGGGAALPLTVLYDAEGKELWRVMGGYDWSSAEARALVAEATASGA
jgi:thiol-disulfide isomerase/thioredoxin